MKIYVRFLFFSEHRKMKKRKSVSNFTFFFFLFGRVFLLQWRKITIFFLKKRRMKSRKTSGKNAGDSGEFGPNVWSKSDYCRLL